jgi:hypothetical protein
MCLEFVVDCKQESARRESGLYVASGLVDLNIFMWKCHLVIIADITVRRAQNVRPKSNSGYRRMSPLTVGYVYCILWALLYPLSNYTPCDLFW